MNKRLLNSGKLFLLFCVHVIVANGAFADEEPAQLGEVTVTGTREATPLFETPAAVSIIKQDTIKFTAPTHPQQLLGQIPGVAINVTNGEGHATGIRQKIGTDAVYLYLEDGIPIRPTGFFNHNALYEVNIPQAGGIEVVRGIGSALYGSDAIGGTVNILTNPPSNKQEFDVSAEVGSYGWYRLLGDANTGTTGNGALRADLNISHTDGWRVKTAYDRQSANLRWDYAPDAGDSAFKTILGYTKIDQQTGANSALNMTDYTNNPTLNARSVAYRKVDALRLSTNFDKELGKNTLVSLTPYVRHNYMDLNGSYNFSTAATGDPRIEISDVSSLGLLAKWRKDYPETMRARVIAGLDVDYSPGKRTEDALNFTGCTSTLPGGTTSYDCYAVGPRIYDYDVTYKSISPYLHTEFSPSGQMRVTAGLRYDAMSYDMSNNLAAGNLVGTTAAKNYYQFASASQSFSHASAKLGLTYAVAPSAHLYASYNQGFRAPSESNLFRAGLDSTPANAQLKATDALQLKPIKADQFELGVRGDPGGWNYDLVGYLLNKKDDLLSQRDPTNQTTIATNNGSTSHKGVELSLGKAITEQWRFDLAYSYAKHTYETWVTNPITGANNNGKDIESAPNVLANARLSWKPTAAIMTQLEWVKMGSYWLDAANTGKYDGHDLWNLRADYKMTRDISLFGRIMNMADKRYADSASGTGAAPTLSPGLPRSYYAGVDVKW